MKTYKISKVLMCFALATLLMPRANIQAQENGPENLALNKTYASSTAESSGNTTLSADKAFDGITNREEKEYSKISRWGTAQLDGTQQPWISVDLGAEKTFQSFVIEWEKTNITSYEIQSEGADGTWSTIYTKPGSEAITNLQEVIHLDAPVTAQKVKLVITGYEDAVAGWKSVSVFEFQIYENTVPDAVLNNNNIALKKTAAASSAESSGATTLSADKAFDGIINREEKEYSKISRWGTSQLNGNEQPWLSVDLGTKQYLRSFVIDFEKTNITAYQIQVSDDNATWSTVYTKPDAENITSTTERIELANAVYGRYVRLHITGYTDAVPNWKSVSVYEFAIYQTSLEALKPEAPTLGSVTEGIIAPVVEKGATTLSMPSVPEGFTIKLHGTDFEQIIDEKGMIYQPLVTSNVKVKFDVSDGEHTQSTKELTVSVPGKVENPITENKPSVIPELREWSGQQGDFSITETTKIVVDPADADELSKGMKEFQQDYKDITGNTINITEGITPSKHDFFFTLHTSDKGLKEEGYSINTTADSVSVEAMNAKGAYWSTRTILQILKQNKTTMPCGTTRDYPKYKLRGFMLDVGRLPFSLDFLKQVTKNMSWYKLNDFQVHLSDNYIWIEEYENPIKDAYSGFRLESSIVGENGVKLTSEDVSYSKSEFREFIQSSRDLGIHIVPEIDTPAHSLALTKVRPDLAMKDTSVSRHFDHLDLDTKYDESLAFVKQIFNEYLTAENPVFDKDTIVNVGTDEYDGKYSEQFRKYTDDMLKFIQDGNRTVRLWGSLSARGGTTQVRHENVQMNIWNNGWANPTAMLQQGYDLINMNDGSLYMVPSGDDSRGGYQDRLVVSSLYNNWTPNNIGGTLISSTEKQMLGASYAMWNDNTDKRTKGLADVDFFDRFFEPLPALSEKMWGEARDKNFEELNAVAAKTGTAPNTNPYYEVASKTDTMIDYDFDKDPITDASGNEYHATNKKNISLVDGKNGKALELKGNSSYIETPIENVGPNSTLKFSMKKHTTSSKDEQILFESAQGSIEIQKDSGKLGFSRLGNTFAFDYVVPENKWVNVELKAMSQQTDLYINGKFVDSISLSSSAKKVGTLIVPLQRIGSKTKAFNGSIDNLSIKKGANAYVDPNEIATKEFTVTTNNQESDQGSEGPIAYAFDNKPNTIWHTQYSPTQIPVNADHPAIVDVDMGKVYNIEKVTYLPRQDSAANGNILKYELYGKEKEDGELKLLSSGTLANNKDLKEFTFDAQNIRYLQIKVLSGTGNFASAAEFKVYKAEEDVSPLQEKVDEVKDMDMSNYTISTVKELNIALEKAEAVLQDDTATEDDEQKALEALNSAIVNLKTRANTEKAKALLAQIADKKLVEKDYTSESWNVFISAKQKVEESIQDVSDISDEQLTSMLHELQSGLEGLKKAEQVVDKTELLKAYDKAEQIKNNDYTEESWATFNKAFESAKTVLADENATQTEVNKVVRDLTGAMEGLKKNPVVVNKEALINTIKIADAIVKDTNRYKHDDDWKAMLKALTKGKEVVASKTATQAEVDDANAALHKTISSLHVNPNTEPTTIESIRNDKYGIEIQGLFEKGTILNVTSVDIKELAKRINDKTYLSNVILEKAFDIHLSKDGVIVSLNGELEISIPLDAVLSKKHLAVIYIDDKGNIQKIPSTVKDNKIIFKTNHLSTYAIVSFEGEEPFISPSKKPSVDTGDQSNLMLYATIMLIGAGALLVMYRKRKVNSK